MIAHFFLKRPVFAAVISIIITMVGAVSMSVSPIEQYPQILPTDVVVATSYPSASADVIATTVAAPLEQKINGVEDMLYMRSSSTNSGDLHITVTFDVKADPAKAEIDVNNRVQSAMAQLPEDVKRNGVIVSRKSSAILQVITVSSQNPAYDQLFISNYASINIIDALKRVEGVGDAALFGPTNYAMRIWLKPERLIAHNLSSLEVVRAIKEQNAQFAVGKFADEPTAHKYDLTYNITTPGRFSSVAEFENIIIRSGKKNTGALRLKDVASVTLGSQSYSFASGYDGQPATAIGVFLQSGANALATAEAVKSELERISHSFPHGITYAVPFDTTNFVKASIEEVVYTFGEAIILVMMVIYLFLQSGRATAIPLVAIPVSLIGTFAGMYAMGFSINLLTLFGLILAIGIVVDDAIVVLENVDRIMLTEGLTPYQAAHKAMEEVTGPIIAIVFALSAVFIPVAFIDGMTGIIYRQFAVTIIISVVLSGIVALTLTPGLCVKILKHGPDTEEAPSSNINPSLISRFFFSFNTFFAHCTEKYVKVVSFFLNHQKIGWTCTGLIVAATAVMLHSIPHSLVPDEDQGYVVSAVISMPGTSFSHTDKTVNSYVKDILQDRAVDHTISLSGYDVLSSAMKTNVGSIFVTLKDWSLRKDPKDDARVFPGRMMAMGSKYTSSLALAFNPPPIIGMSTTGGFEVYLQYKGSGADSTQILFAKTQEILAKAAAHPALGHVQTTMSANVPQYSLEVDRLKAKALGVSIQDIYTTLQTTIGNLYVNDFSLYGRTYNVFIQGEDRVRGKPEDINDIYVRAASGALVPVKALVKVKRIIGPDIIERFNIFPAAKLMGDPAPGFSSGDALVAIEEIASQVLSEEYSMGWIGSAYQEMDASGSGMIAFVFGIIAVFLILASLYEKWSLPLAVVIAVPFAIFGAALSNLLRGLSNDVYFQIGIVTLIGLSAKNAILIVEFAVMEMRAGKSSAEAALSAARLRFRPIIMTSMAFILGCLPLAISTGPGAASRHSIGTGVIGGMIAATVIAPLFVPMFFKFIIDLSEKYFPPKAHG